MVARFGLDIAQAPAITPSPDFLVFGYSDLFAAGPAGLGQALTAATCLYICNYGGRPMLAVCTSGRATYNIVIDPDARMPIVVGAPLDNLQLIDIILAGAAGGVLASLAGLRTMYEPTAGDTPGPGIVTVTVSDVPLQVGAAPVDGFFKPSLGLVEAARTPDTFIAIPGAAVSGSFTPVWTPALGRRFRFLGASLTATPAGSEATLYQLVDGNTAHSFCSWAPPLNQSTPLSLPGNGYLSLTANNALGIIGPTGSVAGHVWGTEE